ncbi:MAG: hypothetical protein HYY51_02350 [Candidatus Magasanikbacteria bacterium]|nr:hypothetical protein [Candidatus Magasanikbacteria bacterium]
MPVTFKDAARKSAGAFLSLLAFGILVATTDAHVSMCMLGAIGYGTALFLPSKAWSPYVSSFFFSWILFYTVYIGTSFLAIEVLSGDLSLVGGSSELLGLAWLYHIIINVFLLMLFWLKLDKMKMVLSGLWAAMLSAPLMFLLSYGGYELWPFEPPRLILWYVFVGFCLLMTDLFMRHHKHSYEHFLHGLRKTIMISLYVFLGITVVPLLYVLFV